MLRALTQVLHYSTEKQTPGEKPDQMQSPIGDRRKLVVVLRVTLAKKAQQVFIDEVEPEEALITQSSEDVPGSCDREEEKCAGNETELAPAPPFAGDEQIREQRSANKDDRHQSLGQDGYSQTGIARVPKARCSPTVEREQGEVKCSGDCECE